MKFFSPEGKFYQFMETLFCLLKVNLLLIVFSLPVITLGGALIAAHDMCLKMLDGVETKIIRRFAVSFKQNFKTGIPYGLLLLFCCYIVWLDFSLFEQVEGNPIVILIMGILAAFVFLLMFLFAFALQARYTNSFFRTLKNSSDICVRYFVRTLTLIVALCVEVFVFCWSPTTLLFGIILGPACVVYTICSYARIFFSEIEKESGSVMYPENNETNEN